MSHGYNNIKRYKKIVFCGSLPTTPLAHTTGFFAGGYGTLIGAGGGFVLVPALLFIYPGEAPETVTSISLAVGFFNALSGTLAYARSNRIHFKSGLVFAAATVPGAVAGALATTGMSRERFNLVFGLLFRNGRFFGFHPGKKTAAGMAQAGSDTKRRLNLNGSP